MTSSTTISNSEPVYILSPATRRELGVMIPASATAVSDAVSKAVAAQPAWAAQRTGERADILEKAAARIDAQAPEWSRLLSEESGKILAQAEFELKLAAGI